MELVLGSYYRELRNLPVSNAESERALTDRLLKGDKKARQELVTGNLRLVVRLARHFAGQGLSLAELVAEGNYGLIQAASHFDPNRNVRFPTYARPWIRHAMLRAVWRQQRWVRVPDHWFGWLMKCRRAENVLKQQLGRKPRLDEVAAKLGVSTKKLDRMEHGFGAVGDISQSDDDTQNRFEAVVDSLGASPERPLIEKDDRELISGLLEGMSERESLILRARFGLDGDEPQTLESIGKSLGLTRQRVRQILAHVLSKLKLRLHQRRLPALN